MPFGLLLTLAGALAEDPAADKGAKPVQNATLVQDATDLQSLPIDGSPAVVPGAAASPPATVVPASLNPLSTLGRDKLKSFVELPLFDPTRRLPPPPIVEVAPPPPPPPPAPPPTVHLLGIIQSKRSIAVIQIEGGSKTQTVATGDVVDGWKVVVLPTLGIELQNGDRVADFTLFNKTNTSPGVTAALAPPVPRVNALEQTRVRMMNARNMRLQHRTY